MQQEDNNKEIEQIKARLAKLELKDKYATHLYFALCIAFLVDFLLIWMTRP